MKKHFYLFAILFALVIFNSPEARADSHGYDNGKGNGGYDNGGHNGNGGNNNGNGGDGTATSANLPINNGIAFLTIAGIAIGIITVKKASAKKAVIA